MFDTVEYHQNRLIHTINDPEWELVRDGGRSSYYQNGYSFVMKHIRTGVTLFGVSNEMITKVFVPSLPQLVDGTNAIGLNGQADVDLALNILERLLNEVTEIGKPNPRKYSRIDIALQVEIPFTKILESYRYARQPYAQKDPSYWGNSTLVLPRSGQRLCFYEKTAQLRVKEKRLNRILHFPPDAEVMRVEVQLTKDKILKHLGRDDQDFVTELDVATAYQALRTILVAIDGEPVLIQDLDPSKKQDVMLRAAFEHPSFYGWMMSGLGKESQSDYRAYVKRRLPELVAGPIRWNDLLPGDRPPLQPQVHLPPDNCEPPFPHWVAELRQK